MLLKDYFRNEIKFLKEEGKAFAKAHPHLSRFLSDESADPDVERLLEGFSFLSARLRQKIDDEFPELTYSILSLLWPNYISFTNVIRYHDVFWFDKYDIVSWLIIFSKHSILKC